MIRQPLVGSLVIRRYSEPASQEVPRSTFAEPSGTKEPMDKSDVEMWFLSL